MTIQHVRPMWAEKLLQFVPKLGRIGVVLSLGLITATQAQQIVDLGILPHLASLLFIIFCVLIGDMMMRGGAAEIRRSLAISTAIRNAALALLIVGTNFPGSPAITIVFVFGLLSLIVSFTYGKLMIDADVQSAKA
jgi:BASS family bile acid:Na+ symporter